MRNKEHRLQPINCDLETTKLLIKIFGYKIIKDIRITLNGGERKDDDK